MIICVKDSNFNFRKRIVRDSTEISLRLEITKYVREGKINATDSILSVYGSTVLSFSDLH